MTQSIGRALGEVINFRFNEVQRLTFRYLQIDTNFYFSTSRILSEHKKSSFNDQQS